MIVALSTTLPLWAAALVLVPAAIAAVASVVSGRLSDVGAAWRVARLASALMALVAVAVGAVRVTDGAGADGFVRIDNVTVAMLALLSLVGWVVVRYSSVYLAGDPHEHRYVRLMLATLAAVSVVVVTNNLVVLVVAWAGTSVALHGLLTFFADRPVAVAVAHKKFLLARCADACMVGSVVAFGTAFDTLRIDAIGIEAITADSLPVGARIGIMLVAIAALLKCAQLPFHGWLIQVMEAPTPVSALLHAGVVNLGGFVLLRFAPVVDRAVETRAVLVVVGVTTAVVASLVMTTRVSVKVSLAWSTCAQMGFMLMQCGLGLWEMALLHLLAHSVYKAHAFLGAGGTVRQTQLKQLAAKHEPPTVPSVAVRAVIAALGTVAIGLAWEVVPFGSDISATVWLMLGIVAFALVPLIGEIGARSAPIALGQALAVPAIYLALKEVAGEVVPQGTEAPIALLVFTGIGFGVLFLTQTSFLVAPDGRLAKRVRPWIYAGLFLDDAFTRVAFAASPPPAPTTRSAPLPQPTVVPIFATDATDAAAGSPVAASR